MVESFISNELKSLEALLEQVETLSQAPKGKPTFMEIAGYPHYENVCSNILSYFLAPDNEHGLDTLFLDSLAASLGREESRFSSVEVRREVTTEVGNRIDLVIETDDIIIAVENKIFAGLANPLEDYSRYLAEILNEDGVKDIWKCVLSIDEGLEPDNGFVPITYKSLFLEIRLRLGFHVSNAEPRSLGWLTDFMTSIENLTDEGRDMDADLIEFVKENQEPIIKLTSKVKELKGQFRNEVHRLSQEISEKGDISFLKTGAWRQPDDFFDIAYFDIKTAMGILAFDVTITLSGWKVVIFFRDADELAYIQKILKQHKDKWGSSIRDGRVLLDQKFSLTCERREVVEFTHEVMLYFANEVGVID